MPEATKVKVIDYMAPWCGPCKAMEPIFEELGKEYAGRVTFERINVDEQQELSNQLGIMSIPTLHILKDNKVVQSLIGFQSKDDLTKYLNAVLA